MRSKKWLIPLLIVLIAVGGFYFFKAGYYQHHFLPTSTANTVNIENMTVQEANKALTKHFNSESFTIKDKKTNWQKVAKKELGIQNEFASSLKKQLAKQNSWLWILSYTGKSQKVKVNNTTLNQDKLTTYLDSLKPALTELNSGRTLTTNASVKNTGTAFEVEPEKTGNSLDIDAAIKGIKAAISKGSDSIELENYLAKPTIDSTNKELKATVDKLNQLSSIKAVYSISGQTIQIPKETIMSWLKADNLTVTLDEASVKAYVEKLGTDYDTSTVPTSFTSTKRGTVSVPAGTYSWTIQTDDETAALKKAILAGKDFTRTPVTQGSATPDQALIGKTYIEVDLVNQHMWYYKDSTLVLETDIVSGKPSTPTPTGVFYVWKKERNATLVGEDYKTPVDHWMPIDWTGVGIHDSPWQTAYGGTRYQTYGSHGCINTPPSVVSQLYDDIEVGVPVIVF